MDSRPITLGDVASAAAERPGRPPAKTIHGFGVSYLLLCKGQARPLTSKLEPRPGDWVLSLAGELDALTLIGDPPRPLAEGEVLVPRLDRVIELLRAEAPSILIDCHEADFGCVAFDADGNSLANYVSRNVEEAALRALLFIRAERAANERRE